MIVSKVDSAREAYRQAVRELREVLQTKRGTKEARAELVMLRESSLSTDICPYCEKQIKKRSSRRPEACEDCCKVLDRLLQFKSLICNGVDSDETLKTFMKAYKSLKFIPAALRGCEDDVSVVLYAADKALVAYDNYKIELRAQRGRNAATYVMEQEKEKILNMLVSCGADINSEETLQRVDLIYESRQH